MLFVACINVLNKQICVLANAMNLLCLVCTLLSEENHYFLMLYNMNTKSHPSIKWHKSYIKIKCIKLPTAKELFLLFYQFNLLLLHCPSGYWAEEEGKPEGASSWSRSRDFRAGVPTLANLFPDNNIKFKFSREEGWYCLYSIFSTWKPNCYQFNKNFAPCKIKYIFF